DRAHALIVAGDVPGIGACAAGRIDRLAGVGGLALVEVVHDAIAVAVVEQVADAVVVHVARLHVLAAELWVAAVVRTGIGVGAADLGVDALRGDDVAAVGRAHASVVAGHVTRIDAGTARGIDRRRGRRVGALVRAVWNAVPVAVGL